MMNNALQAKAGSSIPNATLMLEEYLVSLLALHHTYPDTIKYEWLGPMCILTFLLLEKDKDR